MLRRLHIRQLVLIAAAIVFSTGAFAETPREPLPGTTTYIYRTVGDTRLDLQVLSPADSFARPRPAIVYFFGGGWNHGTVKQFWPFGQELTRRGMVSVYVDYRVAGRHQSTPVDSTVDAQAAMRYIRQNAARLGIDPARIVAAGGSAGGQLALATTLAEPLEAGSVSPAANLLIGYNPVADLREERWRDRVPGDPARISPSALVRAGLPDTLLFHGVADTTVPIKQVRDFCNAMKSAGNDCHLEEAEGAAHGFFNHGRDDNHWYTKVLERTISFLEERGYLE